MTAGAPSVRIRPAVPADVPAIAQFIVDLARYERREHEVERGDARLREHLFGPRPVCEALMAESDGKAVGFALFFTSYSTFRMQPCVHLEDLFVQPESRGAGIGVALLRAVAAVAVERGCPRLDWTVLDGNESAIRFYEKQGARLLPDWRVCRLDGDALARVAAGGS